MIHICDMESGKKLLADGKYFPKVSEWLSNLNKPLIFLVLFFCSCILYNHEESYSRLKHT